ncbi:hypothetical protein SAMN05216232_2140 [Virgibacillus subterraneus]|uniref:Uncharacterized protein n=2 Tax=Virgibacillus TaxID=84406 RepID=A0A1H1BXU7_9BACI|nr:hypothetical protein SAMN05216231_1963 [Virgibacillus salinus]SEQ28809.1 hypothetical protein SAMN05216232_2140 [Virgibacillus subterraneus]
MMAFLGLIFTLMSLKGSKLKGARVKQSDHQFESLFLSEDQIVNSEYYVILKYDDIELTVQVAQEGTCNRLKGG